MSVIKAERRESNYQFEKTCEEIVIQLKHELGKVSKRKHKWIQQPLYKQTQKFYLNVINARGYVFRKKPEEKKITQQLICQSEEVSRIEKRWQLLKMEKKLLHILKF